MKKKQQTFIDRFVLACAILFVTLSLYGNFSLGSKEFARQLGSAVSVSAGVAANEYNTLAQALLQKEKEVDQREAALAERERNTLRFDQGRDTKLTVVVLTVGILLLFLILLNFYLDWRRKP